MFSLRKTLYATTLLAAIILMVVLLMGIRQYSLAGKYDAIIGQSEKLIFQFATIRDHIVDSLLEGRHRQLGSVAAEVETLNSDLSRLLESSLIPGEYKLTFINQVDLAGIALLLRKMETEADLQNFAKQLNGKVRLLGDRLMGFDRIIVGQAKATLVRFQSVVIGGLAIVLCIFSFLLILWYRRLAVPLINMVRQTQKLGSGRFSLVCDNQAFDELSILADTFGQVQNERQKSALRTARFKRVLEAIDKAGKAMRKANSPEELAGAVCRALLVDTDYALVWFGVPDIDSNTGLKPLAVDGSTTMDLKEYEGCLELLLAYVKEKGEDHNPALQTLRTGKPLVVRNFLADMPRGPLKHTPLASDVVDYAVLPVSINNDVIGVLSIYATVENGFQTAEIMLLGLLAREIAQTYRFLELDKSLQESHARAGLLFERSDEAVFLVNPVGTVLEGNEEAARLLGRVPSALQGLSVVSLFFEDADSVPVEQLTAALADEEPVSFDAAPAGFGSRIRFLISSYKSVAFPLRLIVVQEIKENEGEMTDLAVRMCGLAAIGEITTGVVHEISNLVNGVINYAQVLVDEFEQQGLGSAKAELAKNMVRDGERIASVLHQVLYFSNNQGVTKRLVPMATVFKETLSLIGQQLRNDGISLKVAFPDDLPMVQVNREHLHLVFLNLFINARHSLNRRYPGQNENKRLEVKGEVVFSKGRSLLRSSVTDWGMGVHPEMLEKLTEPFFSTKEKGEGTGLGLTISKQLIEENGGSLEIQSVQGDRTTFIVDFPVASK